MRTRDLRPPFRIRLPTGEAERQQNGRQRRENENDAADNQRENEPIPIPPPLGDGAIQEPRNNNNNNNNNLIEVHHNTTYSAMGSTVMGALFFPAISSLMGDLIKLSLPAKWVSNQGGLLKQKWGSRCYWRLSVVVLKDAVVLYCKWRKARDFGKKRILDFRGQRGVDAA